VIKKLAIFVVSIIMWMPCNDIFAAVEADTRHIGNIPKVVGEDVTNVPIAKGIAGLWKTSGQISVKKSDVIWYGKDVLAVNYWLQKSNDSVQLDYSLAKDHPVSERLRFWIKSDGSCSDLEVLCYHTLSKSWISLATIKLNSSQWLHLEIPASNPLYQYYSSVTAFRFVVSNKENVRDFGEKQLLFSGMELVNPVVVERPLQNRPVASPVFDTWGGPSRQQFLDSKPVGTTVHLAPIGFFGDTPVPQRVDYALKAVKWAGEAGIGAGIQFYGHPGKWIESHPEMFPKNQEGKIQRDVHSGGTFTSPWNPQAKTLWRQHIIDCLNYLKDNNSLKDVQVVQLCPGEECELCFHWTGVWAFDDYAIKDYRTYLKEFYRNDVARLNQDWGSSHSDFNDILPPGDYYPDRSHWVFTDFYRLSMLRYCVFLADSVKEVFTPKYWLWMTHTLPRYPERFNSARYAIFYAENLRRLGYIDYAQIAALDWQGVEDVQYLQSLAGLKVIGEIDVQPTEERLKWTFEQCKKFGTDGVFIGVLEPLSSEGRLTALGKTGQQLIRGFTSGVSEGKEVSGRKMN